MKEFTEIIKDYHKLVEMLEDSKNFFCFDTKNGKRMIVKLEDRRKCIAIDKNFRAVSFKNENELTFYDSPLSLIESYFYDGGVSIDDILITLDKIEAFSYLQEQL